MKNDCTVPEANQWTDLNSFVVVTIAAVVTVALSFVPVALFICDPTGNPWWTIY